VHRKQRKGTGAADGVAHREEEVDNGAVGHNDTPVRAGWCRWLVEQL
jgi:hypothetical protein